jgi:mxaK protein
MTRSRPAVRHAVASIAAAYRKARTALIAGALVTSTGALAALSWQTYEASRDNRIIRALQGGDDVAVDLKTASPEVMIARARFLIERDRREDAQRVVDASARLEDYALRAVLLYNHANARIRDAIALVGRGDLDKAIPITRLAKDEYRLALRLDPSAWDIKYNYDVAMRVVRDFPGAEPEGEELPPDAPKRLWTDLPGVPRGAP